MLWSLPRPSFICKKYSQYLLHINGLKHVAILGCLWLYMLCFDGINQLILFYRCFRCIFSWVIHLVCSLYDDHVVHSVSERWVSVAGIHGGLLYVQFTYHWKWPSVTYWFQLHIVQYDCLQWGAGHCSNHQQQTSSHWSTTMLVLQLFFLSSINIFFCYLLWFLRKKFWIDK